MYNIDEKNSVSINKISTATVAVLKNGNILQGKVEYDIEIWAWNQEQQKY